MAQTFNQKLNVLSKLLNQYKKYAYNCKKITCYIEGEFIIIKKFNVVHEVYNATKKVPRDHINIIIKNYRARIYQEKNKNN